MKYDRSMLWLVIILVFGLTDSVWAQLADDQSNAQTSAFVSAPQRSPEKRRNVLSTEPREIKGPITALSKNYIEINYYLHKNIEKDMGLLIEAPPKLENVADFKQLHLGDTVKVIYDYTSEEDENGRPFNRRAAKTIIF